MKASFEKIEKNLVELQVEVEAEKFTEALNKTIKKMAGKANIPGFRKGKAPKAMIVKYYGKEVLYNEALDAMLPDAYFQAVLETEIEPVDRPEVEIVSVEEGQPLVFKAKVQVKPEVELGQYTGLEVEKPAQEVNELDVKHELDQLQQRHAKIVTLDQGNVVAGDIAVIDFEGFVDGVAFPGGTGSDYPLEIGSNTFIPGFEDQVVGASIGEVRDVNVTFPEEYHSQDLAGKDALFKVTVKGLRRKEVLPLDDELAKDVSDFDTLDELKEDITNKLKERAEQQAEAAIRNQVIEKAVGAAKVELPEVMVDSRVNEMLNEMGQRLQRQGISLEDYFKFTGADMANVRKDLRPEAEKSVLSDLVLEAIARKENIDATDEEVEAELAKMAANMNQEVSALKQMVEAQGNLDMLKNSIAFQKTIQFLIDNAKIS